MSSYFLKDYWSWDISFCGSDCKNTECSRNQGSKLFKEYLKRHVPYEYFSQADFGGKCDEYKK